MPKKSHIKKGTGNYSSRPTLALFSDKLGKIQAGHFPDFPPYRSSSIYSDDNIIFPSSVENNFIG